MNAIAAIIEFYAKTNVLDVDDLHLENFIVHLDVLIEHHWDIDKSIAHWKHMNEELFPYADENFNRADFLKNWKMDGHYPLVRSLFLGKSVNTMELAHIIEFFAKSGRLNNHIDMEHFLGCIEILIERNWDVDEAIKHWELMDKTGEAFPHLDENFNLEKFLTEKHYEWHIPHLCEVFGLEPPEID